jgi:two-component system, OmpR family, KDP operon response regulator KdpE
VEWNPLTKILIINDENITSNVDSYLLGSNMHEIKSVNSRAEGVSATKVWEPDIVIIDSGIPNQDGWKICRDIRLFSQVPILVLSILNNPEIVVRALDEGADDFLPKPVREEVLMAHINKLTRRKKADVNGFLDNIHHYNQTPPLNNISD